MIGADENTCKRHAGRPSIVIKRVDEMLTDIRKYNDASDVTVYIAEKLKDDSDSHLTNYSSQVLTLISERNSIDINDVLDKSKEHIKNILINTADVNLERYKELHDEAILLRDGHLLDMNKFNDNIKYLEYNIKNLELYEPLNKLKLALIDMLRQRCH